MTRWASHIIALVLAASLTPLAAIAQDTPEAVLPATGPYQWEICNETSFVLRTAYGLPDQGKIMVRGWQTLIPGACQSVEHNDAQAPRFLYAESLPLHRGGIREWKGQIELCANEEDFESEATDNCALKNLLTRSYLAIKPAESRTSLIEPSDFGTKAETAGVQRLMRDVGYKITSVDGLPGRRTSRSIKDFIKEMELDKDITTPDLIAALSAKAQETVETIGLQLCNDSSAKIWGAIATRSEGNWQSRGWWDVEPATCTHLYTKSLQGSEAHIYALQENINPEEPDTQLPDKRLRSVATTPAQFCVAESRFSALGRDFCAEGGYVAANFRPVKTDEDGIKITLSDTDFAVVSAAGLRR